MSLILAIEPDARQSRELRDLVHRRLRADLVHAPTTEGALAALAGVGDRVPDLVLVPSLLSPQEDAAIAGALRLIAAAANVRMLTIPLLARAEEPAKAPGMLARLRGKKPRVPTAGCDPDVFADQIAAYLQEAAAERKAAREELEDTGAMGLPAVAPAGAEVGADVDAHALPKQTYKPLIIQPAAVAASVDSPAVEAPKADAWPDRSGDAIREFVVRPEPAPLGMDAPGISAVGESLMQPAASAPAQVVQEPTPAIAAAEDVMPQPPAPAAVRQQDIDPIMEAIAAAVAQQPLERKTVSDEDVKARFFASRVRIPKASAKPIAPLAVVEPEVQAAAQPETVATPPVVSEPIPAATAAVAAAEPVTPAAVTPQRDEPKHRASRSRIRLPKHSAVRKAANAKPPSRKEREEIDVDALIAPLLTDMAAKRSPTSAPAGATLGKPAAPIAPSAPIARSAPTSAPVGASVGKPSDDVDPMFFAGDALTAPPPTPAQAERSAWLELVESLRQDIERLKADKTPEAPPASEPPAVQAPQSVVAKAVSAIRRRPTADVVSMPAPEARASRVKPRKPVQDQWGLFDPEQCGFAALIAKLDEIESREEISA